jgi:hypothetical protein
MHAYIDAMCAEMAAVNEALGGYTFAGKVPVQRDGSVGPIGFSLEIGPPPRTTRVPPALACPSGYRAMTFEEGREAIARITDDERYNVIVAQPCTLTWCTLCAEMIWYATDTHSEAYVGSRHDVCHACARTSAGQHMIQSQGLRRVSLPSRVVSTDVGALGQWVPVFIKPPGSTLWLNVVDGVRVAHGTHKHGNTWLKL